MEELQEWFFGIAAVLGQKRRKGRLGARKARQFIFPLTANGAGFPLTVVNLFSLSLRHSDLKNESIQMAGDDSVQ